MLKTDPAVADGLTAWAQARWGGQVRVLSVADLGGHSGRTYGFIVEAVSTRADLVIRIAPPGVAHRGSADVLRQAPLLRFLHGSGVRVAGVVEASSDPKFFGAPFHIVERLPGRALVMGPDADRSWLSAQDQARAHLLAVDELARIHAVDWRGELRAWEQPKTLVEEIDFWAPILQRSPETARVEAGLALRERLLELVPQTANIGICHGDFQLNNLLFTGAGETLALGGVVDWEVAHIGAVEHDLAWLLMMNDPAAWDPVEQRGGVDLAALVARYEDASGRTIQGLSWYWALACYRIAAIATYNIRLHRSGRRPDPAWARAASSVPVLFARAAELLMS